MTAPAAGPSSEWSAASELAEVERMAEMGIVLKPSEEGRRRKGKGKAREMPAGHVVFVDDREECKFKSLELLLIAVETFGSSRPSPSNIVAGAEAEEEVDLGWATPVSRRKKREQPPPTADEVDEGDLEEEARVSHESFSGCGTTLTASNIGSTSSPISRLIWAASSSSDWLRRNWRRQKVSWAKEQQRRSGMRSGWRMTMHQRIETENGSGRKRRCGSGRWKGSDSAGYNGGSVEHPFGSYAYVVAL